MTTPMTTDPREDLDDLGMMRRADLWPRWPMLPVKSPPWQVGYLIEDYDALVSLVALPTVFDYRTNAPLVEFDSLEELVAAGWRID